MLGDDVERLAALAAAGDGAAMDQLLRRIQPEVLRRCGRFLPCVQDAEEACQDALLRVAGRLPGFQWRSTCSTWLHTVVSNSALSTYRSLKRRADRQLSDDELLTLRADPRTTSVIAGSRLDLLNAVARFEADRPHLVAVRAARHLPAQLRRDRGQLAVPLGTVKSQIHDARKAVQKLIAEQA